MILKLAQFCCEQKSPRKKRTLKMIRIPAHPHNVHINKLEWSTPRQRNTQRERTPARLFPSDFSCGVNPCLKLRIPNRVSLSILYWARTKCLAIVTCNSSWTRASYRCSNCKRISGVQRI